MNKKMADVDIDPFGEHELRPEEPTDEDIHLTPVGYFYIPITPQGPSDKTSVTGLQS